MRIHHVCKSTSAVSQVTGFFWKSRPHSRLNQIDSNPVSSSRISPHETNPLRSFTLRPDWGVLFIYAAGTKESGGALDLSPFRIMNSHQQICGSETLFCPLNPAPQLPSTPFLSSCLVSCVAQGHIPVIFHIKDGT